MELSMLNHICLTRHPRLATRRVGGVVRSVTHTQQLGSWLKVKQFLNLQQPAARQNGSRTLRRIGRD